MPDPSPHSLEELRARLPGCRACPLWEHATQAVPGAGAAGAALMLVGEQPGDQEDRAGEPFVGPAGKLLDRAMADAGLARDATFITNAVKHFKHLPRGKRRIHQKPNAGEVDACKFWLLHEMRLVAPRVVVAMGATAARALWGGEIAINKARGQLLEREDRSLVITFHPSSILRLPDQAARERQYRLLVDDLALAAKHAA